MRTVAVAILLALGALFAFSANATAWANRTIFDTDTFVRTVDDVLQEPEVQAELADRLTTRLMVRADVEQRLSDRADGNLQFLVPSLVDATRNLIYNAILRALQSDRFQAIYERALTTVHAQLIAILEDDSALQFNGDSIVIDLGEILTAIVQDLGLDRVEGLLENADIPEDAGQIVLVEDASNASLIAELAKLHNTIVWFVIGLAIAAFGLAILISKDRRGTTRTVGYTLIVVGILAAVALVGIRQVAKAFAQNGTVAGVAFDQLVEGFRAQSFAVVLAGLLIGGLAALFGPTALARAVRGGLRRDSSVMNEGLRTELRQNATALRVGGLAIGALVLLGWPDPSTRVYVTLFAIIAAYLVAIWIATSNSDTATNARDRVASGWTNAFSDRAGESRYGGVRGWIFRYGGILRLIGLLIALALLLFWPGLSIAGAAVIIGLALLYFAAVEWVAPAAEPA